MDDWFRGQARAPGPRAARDRERRY
jgi:hypothetical protein